MNAIVDQGLQLWGIAKSDYTLIAARENAVYKVFTNAGPVALRLHRQGYRSDAELRSELQWMAAVSKGGLTVPAPIPSSSNLLLHVIDGIQVDVLTWLSGATMDDALDNHPDHADLFERLGQDMARLHIISDAWIQPHDFTRCVWDRDGLLGKAPLWNCFWKNPALTRAERTLFLAMRDKANAQLSSLEQTLDYGLIHADLVAANVLINGNQIHLIDFDDGGFGFRLFDIATALLKHDDPALRTALINGYTSVRPIDLSALDLFMLLRAATYVGWNITRMNEDGGDARNTRFIDTAKRLATAYMKT